MIGFLANESPWPARNGGRTRMAGLVRELRPHTVLVARGRRTDPVVPPAEALPQATRSRAAALVGTQPRLGRGLLGREGLAELRRRCSGLDALVVSHSYLAAVLPDLGLPLVVDFPNVEAERQAGIGGVVGHAEAWKARRWEPQVARRAALCVCVDDRDAGVVSSWGAPEVLVVPNAVDVPVSPPSPPGGYALLVGDWQYGPNDDALRWFEAEVAPHLSCPVVVAGRGSERVPGGVGFVEDLDALYDGAAVVIGPTRRGAGTQLKVVEALTRGRLVVTTAHSARSVPAGAGVGAEIAVTAADLVAAVQRLVADVEMRSRREAALRQAPFARGWGQAVAPLVRALEAVRHA